jgi:hypothetical protein
MPTSLQKYDLGVAIAQVYIAAQGVSLSASDAACDAIMKEDSCAKLGFDSEIKRDGRYQISARIPNLTLA